MFKAADNLVEEVLARIQLRNSRDEAIGQCQAQSEYQQRLTEALTQSTQGLFQTMCSIEMKPTGIQHTCNRRAQYELNGIISVSGKLKITVVLSLTKQLAFNVVDAFLGSSTDVVNSDVIDVVGELTNMISGNAKERLAIAGLSLGLPTVVAGSNMIVAFESGLNISQLAFESPQGAMSIMFGVRG